MRMWIQKAGFLIGLAAFAGLAAVLIFLPAAAAYACPQCYGLSKIRPGLYVETQTSEAARVQIIDSLEAANKRIEAFYSKRVTNPPTILACASRSCEERLGGKGAKARAYGATFIHVAPEGWNKTILAHELSHIEFHGRIGLLSSVSGALPAWFDEGLAVIVSQDARYLSFDADGMATCTEPESHELPESRQEWRREAGRGERPIYAMAACRVLHWIRRNGGRAAAVSLAEHLRQGGIFYE